MKATEDRYYRAVGASLARYLKELREIKKAFGISDMPGAGMSSKDPRYDELCSRVIDARTRHEVRCLDAKVKEHIA